MIRFFIDRRAIADNREKENKTPPIIIEVDGKRVMQVFGVQTNRPFGMAYEMKEYTQALGEPPKPVDPAAPELWVESTGMPWDFNVQTEYQGFFLDLHELMKEAENEQQ